MKTIHIQYWPVKAAALPPVICAAVDGIDGFLLVGPETGTRAIAHELFLRQLFQLDLGSPATVVAFIEENGVLVPPDKSFLPLEEAPALAKALAETRQVGEAPALKPGWRSVPLAEVLLYLRLLRDFVRALDPMGRYARTDSRPCWSWESSWRRPPATPEKRTDFVACYLNASLRPYRLRFAEAESVSEPAAYLYPVLCMQIVNYLADGFDFQTCPTCETLFVRREEPGEEKKPWRGKAKYCSRECAVTDAKRSEYARRLEEGWVPPAIRNGWAIPRAHRKYAEDLFRANPAEEEAYRERVKVNAWMEERWPRQEKDKKPQRPAVPPRQPTKSRSAAGRPAANTWANDEDELSGDPDETAAFGDGQSGYQDSWDDPTDISADPDW